MEIGEIFDKLRELESQFVSKDDTPMIFLLSQDVYDVIVDYVFDVYKNNGFRYTKEELKNLINAYNRIPILVSKDINKKDSIELF